jgi:multidrug efflux system outer membrane protein
LIAGILLLSGCAFTANRSVREMDLPRQWPENQAMTIADPAEAETWWSRFQDPVLDQLVDRAIHGNTDIRLQAARVQEARARLGFARAEQLPTVGLQAEVLRQRQSGAATGIAGTPGTTGNLFSLAGILSYELDLWGRLAKEREAAEAALQSNRFIHEAVRQSVVADVVTTYFHLRAAQQQLTITWQTVALQQETYDLEQVRYRGGQIDELALRQAESQLETTKAMLPVQERQMRMLEGVLGLLAGLSPAEMFDAHGIVPGPLQAITHPGPVPMVLPATLLERRPDIRAAEAAVNATGAAIGAAVAARLPRLNLATLIGTAATDFGDLFTTPARAWQFGGQAAGTLLDFGRNQARVRTAEAQWEQAQIQYEATVHMAFNEVRDALILYRSAVEHQKAVERLVDTVRRTRHLAQIRYHEGMVGLIDFLDAQRSLFAAEQSLNTAVRDRLTAAATLQKALGGGWNPDSVGDAYLLRPGIKVVAAETARHQSEKDGMK